MDRPRCSKTTLRNPYTKNCVQCVKAPKGATRTQKEILVQWNHTLGLVTAGRTVKDLCAQLLGAVNATNTDLDVLLYEADRRARVTATNPQEQVARQKAARALEAARQMVGDDESAARALETMLGKVNLGAPSVTTTTPPPRQPFAAPRKPLPTPQPFAAPRKPLPTPLSPLTEPTAQPAEVRQFKRRTPDEEGWQAPGTYTSEVEPELEIVVGNNGDATVLFQGTRIVDLKGVRELWKTTRGSYVLRTDGAFYYVGFVHQPDGSWKRQWYQFKMQPGDSNVATITKNDVLVSNNNVYLLEFKKRLNKVPDWANFAFWYQENYEANSNGIHDALMRGNAPDI